MADMRVKVTEGNMQFGGWREGTRDDPVLERWRWRAGEIGSCIRTVRMGKSVTGSGRGNRSEWRG